MCCWIYGAKKFCISSATQRSPPFSITVHLRLPLDSLFEIEDHHLYIITVMDNIMRRKESNVSSLPELTNFEVSYSLVTNEVYLSASFTDNMACIPNWPLQEFPDQLSSKSCCPNRRAPEDHQLYGCRNRSKFR